MSAVERARLAPGYEISRLLMGGWQLAGGHGPVDRQQAAAGMARFVKAGIDTFDCADIYTGVEELIGEFLRAHGGHGIRVHTKFVPDLDVLPRITEVYTRRIVDRSRQRLGVDKLDLVQFHWWDYMVPGMARTARWLGDMQGEGLIDRVGLTNVDTVNLARVLEAGVDVTSVQLQYSLLDRRAERRLVPFCREHGIGLLCYGALAGGFMSEAWLGAAEPADLTNRSLIKYKLVIDDAGGWPLFQRLLRALRDVAARYRVSVANVAVRWVLERPGVAGVIVGARSARRLNENLAVFSFALDDEDYAHIEAALTGRRELPGDVYALERDRSGRHGSIMKYNLNAVT